MVVREGRSVSAGEDEKLLETDGGDGCTTTANVLSAMEITLENG